MPDRVAAMACRSMCPRPDGSFWVCSLPAGHDCDHSWAGKPTEFWGGDPDVVRPSDLRAESQAGLSGPSGSPTSPPQRDDGGYVCDECGEPGNGHKVGCAWGAK